MQTPNIQPRKSRITLTFSYVALLFSSAVAVVSVLICHYYEIMTPVIIVDSGYLFALIVMCFYVQKAQVRADQRYQEEWNEFKRQWDQYLQDEASKSTPFRKFVYSRTNKEDDEGFDIEIKIVNDLGCSETYPYSFIK